jgi:hypothetical protein
MALLMVGLPVPAYGMSLPTQLSPILAQTDTLALSDEDISNFADAYRSIQTIKQDAEVEMVEAVEAEGLTVEQFNTIVDSQLNADAGTAAGVSDEENSQFEAAVASIISIRQNAELEMQSAIENQGISVDKFNQIIDQASQDNDLRQQISDELNQ